MELARDGVGEGDGPEEAQAARRAMVHEAGPAGAARPRHADDRGDRPGPDCVDRPTMWKLRRMWLVFSFISEVCSFETQSRYLLNRRCSNTRLGTGSTYSLSTHTGALHLRGGSKVLLPVLTLRKVNGQQLTADQLYMEMNMKGHDLICKKGWIGPKWNSAVQTFSALDEGKSYVTVRSSEHAYRIHMNTMQNGAVDLSPISGPAY